LVGILVALAIPRLESKTVVTSTTGVFARKGSEELFKCPYCAEWVKSEAKVCRFCGKDIAQQISQLSEQEQKLDEKQRKAEQFRFKTGLCKSSGSKAERRQFGFLRILLQFRSVSQCQLLLFWVLPRL
jgi:hypothetical protein